MSLAGLAWGERPLRGAGAADVQGCPLDDCSGDCVLVFLFLLLGPTAHASLVSLFRASKSAGRPFAVNVIGADALSGARYIGHR